MQTVRQRLGVRIMVFIELHGVPAVLAPVLPVLHQHIGRQSLLAETVGRLQDLVGRMEALTAMDIAKSPLRHLGSSACHLAVGGDDLIRRTSEDGIVHGLCHRRTEGGGIRHLFII